MINKDHIRKLFIQTGTKMRTLHTYSEEGKVLRKQHELYISFLTEHFIPPTFSHAYTKRRSIFTNAKVHMYNDVFIKIDVKNFFPSLNHHYLTNQMLFELNKRKQNSISQVECKSIIDSCSISRIGLPLGFLTSPILSNIYMKKFDGIFYSRVKKLNLEGFKYTRYADDIFISFKNPRPDSSNHIVKICEEELSRCHLRINRKKTKIIDLGKSNHAKLAGVNVVKTDKNYRKLTVSRETIKDLYFRTMHIQEKLAKANTNQSKLDIGQEIQSIKGMQAFILSIHKNGYSNILSDAMQQSVKNHGHDSLEKMISNMTTIES